MAMANEELEQVIDVLADVQQALGYVLFKRERRTLSTDGEQESLRKAANRLRDIANRLDASSIQPLQEDSYERRLPARRS